jgi:hypothetical protein
LRAASQLLAMGVSLKAIADSIEHAADLCGSVAQRCESSSCGTDSVSVVVRSALSSKMSTSSATVVAQLASEISGKFQVWNVLSEPGRQVSESVVLPDVVVLPGTTFSGMGLQPPLFSCSSACYLVICDFMISPLSDDGSTLSVSVSSHAVCLHFFCVQFMCSLVRGY